MRDWKPGFLRNALIGVLALGFVGCANVDKSGAQGMQEGEEVHAGNAKVGMVVGADAFCGGPNATEKFMKAFIGAVVEHGVDSYVHILSLPGIPCRDSRIHGNKTLGVELVEEKWAFTSKEGESFVVWLAHDDKKNKVYLWLHVVPDLTNQK